MLLKTTLLALGLLVGLCVAAATSTVAATLSTPPSYEVAVQATLARRGITPTALTVAVCPAGPTACYQRVYGAVQFGGERTADGFFNCTHGNADCRLTVPGLEIRGAAMPDIAAAGSRSERRRATLDYYGTQLRAVLQVRLSRSS